MPLPRKKFLKKEWNKISATSSIPPPLSAISIAFATRSLENWPPAYINNTGRRRMLGSNYLIQFFKLFMHVCTTKTSSLPGTVAFVRGCIIWVGFIFKPGYCCVKRWRTPIKATWAADFAELCRSAMSTSCWSVTNVSTSIHSYKSFKTCCKTGSLSWLVACGK